MFQGNVYLLCDVSAWGVTEHLKFFRIPLGAMDAEEDGERILKDVTICADDRDHYILEERDGKLYAGYKDRVAELS